VVTTSRNSGKSEYLTCLSSGRGCTVMPSAPNSSQSIANFTKSGRLAPRELRINATLLIFTLNFVLTDNKDQLLTMTLRFTFVAVIIVNVATIFGQKAPSFDPSMVIYDVEPIVCPAGHLHSNHYVPPRVNPKLNASKKKEITIIPSYSPGTPPEVRTAIEEKVFPIIEADFSSPVPLRISFNWSQQAAGILPYTFSRENSQKKSQWC